MYLFIPNVGPTSFPNPGAVNLSAANFTSSRFPAIYAPFGAIPPPKFLIKEPTITSAPIDVGSYLSTNSP